MPNKSKAKGTRAETKVVKYLESLGFKARRKALEGSNDKGDVELFDAPRLSQPLTLEIKAGKQTSNPNRAQLTEWLRQARVEEENSGQRTVLVVVRYNRRLEDADVWLEYEDGDGYHTVAHEFFDDFANSYS